MDKLFTDTNTAYKIRPGEMDFFVKFREIKKKQLRIPLKNLQVLQG